MIIVKDKELSKMQLDNKLSGGVKKKAPPVKKEIDANTKATLELVAAVRALGGSKGKESPVSATLIEAIKQIQATQQDVVALMQKDSKPQEWEFAVTRNKSGTIDKISARETSSINGGS